MTTIQKRLTTLAVAMFFGSPFAVASDDAADNTADANAPAQRSSVEIASKAASDAAKQAIESIARESADDLDVSINDLKLTVRAAAPVTIAAN